MSPKFSRPTEECAFSQRMFVVRLVRSYLIICRLSDFLVFTTIRLIHLHHKNCRGLIKAASYSLCTSEFGSVLKNHNLLFLLIKSLIIYSFDFAYEFDSWLLHLKSFEMQKILNLKKWFKLVPCSWKIDFINRSVWSRITNGAMVSVNVSLGRHCKDRRNGKSERVCYLATSHWSSIFWPIVSDVKQCTRVIWLFKSHFCQ